MRPPDYPPSMRQAWREGFDAASSSAVRWSAVGLTFAFVLGFGLGLLLGWVTA